MRDVSPFRGDMTGNAAVWRGGGLVENKRGGGQMGVFIYCRLWWLGHKLRVSCCEWNCSYSSTKGFASVFGKLWAVSLSQARVPVVRPWWRIWRRLRSPQWCAIITVPDVALFHSHFTTDLYLTMDPADFKVPLSFLHGWWTPHLSSSTQHEHCSAADDRVRPWGQSPLRSSSSFPDIDCGLFDYSHC